VNSDYSAGVGDDVLTPLDRSVVGSFQSAEFARQGARVLRYVAGLIALCAIVGEYLVISDKEYRDLSGGRKVGFFLSSIASPLAIAGLVAAASLLVTAYIAGLELGSVAGTSTDDDDTGGVPMPANEG
jgi:hypothetical protein